MDQELERITTKSLEGIWRLGEQGAPTVVLFHGYGADAADLAPLWRHLRAPKGTTWIFPEGPLSVPIGPSFEGRAWFPINVEALERAMAEGHHRDLSAARPPGLDAAKSKALSFFKELQLDLSNTVIGGFSQGAMLATEIALTSAIKPRGLVALSGTLLDEKNWRQQAASCKGMRFFQSHGEDDPLLAYSSAQKLESLFVEAGMDGQLLSFRGGHEIPPYVIRDLSSFLQDILGR